jgi:DNA polymerase III delta prime subunit
MENISYKKDGIEYLAVLSNGDMRNAIKLLQSTSDRSKEITFSSVSDACDKPPPLLIKEILKSCMNNKLKDAIKLYMELKSKGFTGNDIITNSFSVLKLNITNDISDVNKVNLLHVISEYMYLLSKYMDTETHLMSFLIDLNKSFT